MVNRTNVLVCTLACLLLATAAAAQSAISGEITDNTGGILPGVTVEATSPAMIEGSRVAVSDGQGRYLIVNLVPGTYAVSFTLPGFSTFLREDLVLPADFTATVDAQLSVGNIEESVTVTGESPVVDVQNTVRRQVLDRETMDAIPTGHTIYARAQLLPSIRMSQVDVGGTRAMQTTYIQAQGADNDQTSININGMSIMSMNSDGSNTGYYNEYGYGEISIETTLSGADTSRGGVSVNMIPRAGGNAFSGSGYVGGMNSGWQSDNFDQELADLGLSSVTSIDRIYDYNISQGGPILQDKLWFFSSYREWVTDQPIADSFYKAGSPISGDGVPSEGFDLNRPGIDDSLIRTGLVRLTWQINPTNKLQAHMDRGHKERFNQHSVGWEIETASRHWTYPILGNGQVMWTSTPSSRLLFEAGWSPSWNSRNFSYQEGIAELRNTPAWFAKAAKEDRSLGTRWDACPNCQYWIYSRKPVASATMSYVTGSHAFKVGLSHTSGSVRETFDSNADLEQEYRNGVADSVQVWNYPLFTHTALNYDLGLYAQDTWTVNRLTINAGIRAEWFNAQVVGTESPAGRFTPLRRFPDIEDLPNWFDVLPRFGIAYDLFGDAKTAIKFSANRYMDGQTDGFSRRYNPSDNVAVRLDWNDLNGDDIAQEGEFNPNLLPTNFGERSLNTPDPDIERAWNVMTSLGVDHELMPGVSVNGAWIRRTQHDIQAWTSVFGTRRQTDNLLLGLDDFHPVTIVNPINGLPVTVYDLNNRSLQSQVDNLDQNATTPTGDHPHAGVAPEEAFNSFEAGFNARLPNGAVMFGGWTMDKTTKVFCNSPDDPNTFRFCNESGLDRESGIDVSIPYRHTFKLSGNYPLPFDIRASGSIQVYHGRENPVIWNISRTARYPSDPAILARVGVTGTCIGCEDLAGQRVITNQQDSSIPVRLDTPGTRYREAIKLLDLGFGKSFDFGGRLRMELLLDIFNVLNQNAIQFNTTTFGRGYGRPNTVMTGRYAQIGAEFDW